VHTAIDWLNLFACCDAVTIMRGKRLW